MHSPTAGGASRGNLAILLQFDVWSKTHREGRVYDFNGGFYLPDGSMLSPDAAYVTPESLQGLTREDPEHFLYRTPDFIIELLSISDQRSKAEAKMNSWITNGVQLAWLIDPYTRTATIYSPGDAPLSTSGPHVEGAGPVGGLTMELEEIWSCYEI